MDNKFLDKSAHIRTPSSEVKLGMFVAELDRPWLGTPFLTQGFIVSSLPEVKQTRELCNHVYMEKKRGGYEQEKKNPLLKPTLTPTPSRWVLCHGDIDIDLLKLPLDSLVTPPIADEGEGNTVDP